MTFEINSQNTKAIGGSNCNRSGANMFQLNQIAVHAKTIKKNPMEPTRRVIHNANLSSGVSFSAASLFMFRGGLRRLITSASDGGRAGVVDEVVLMGTPSLSCFTVNRSRYFGPLPAINLYIARCQSMNICKAVMQQHRLARL